MRGTVRRGNNLHLSVFSPSFHAFPPMPSGRGKGASNHPPYLALSIFVHCPPVPTKASLSEQAGANIHPRMRGGMKSGQGSSPFVRTPGPSPEGLPEGGHDLRTPNPSAGRYGGKGENEAFSLVAPPCDPVPTSPSVPKAKLLLEHEDTGRTGRRSALKGKGDSGGGCKEGAGGNYRRTGIKRKNSDVTPLASR